jgi:hypothetical protein
MNLSELAKELEDRDAVVRIQKDSDNDWVVWVYAAESPAIFAMAANMNLEASVKEALEGWDENGSEEEEEEPS